MKRLAALTFVMACGSTRRDVVQEEAAAAAPPPPVVDAAPAPAPAPDVAPPKWSSLPPAPSTEVSSDTSFAPKLDPADPAGRYALATGYVSAEPDRALALLAELRSAECDGCIAQLARARWDEAWSPLWDRAAFVALVGNAFDRPVGSIQRPDDLACPAGTKRKSKWGKRSGSVWCVKGKLRHGPYFAWSTDPDDGGHENYESTLGEYRDGMRHGLWSEDDGINLNHDGAYVDDAPIGVWGTSGFENYYEVYLPGGGRSVRYDDDFLELTELLDGAPHGLHRAWFDEAPHSLRIEGTHDHGKRHGTWRTYDTTGQLRQVETFDADVPHGRFASYAADGALLGETTLDHGSGPWIAFDPDGRRVEAGELADGERTGAWTYWYADGRLRAEGSYVADRPDGHWVVHGEGADGQTQELDFKRGKLLKVDGEPASAKHLEAYDNGWWGAPSPIDPDTD